MYGTLAVEKSLSPDTSLRMLTEQSTKHKHQINMTMWPIRKWDSAKNVDLKVKADVVCVMEGKKINFPLLL